MPEQDTGAGGRPAAQLHTVDREPRSPRWRIVLRWAFRLGVLFAIYYVLRYRVEWDEFATAFRDVSWFYVLLALVANLASIMLKVGAWKIIFDYTFPKVHSRWRDLTSALMIGFFVNLLVPARLGELARAFVISRREALRGYFISRSTVFGTIVLERVFDGAAMAFIVLYGVFRLHLPSWANRGAIIILVVAAVFAITVIILELKSEQLQTSAAAAQASIREHHSWWRKLRTRLHATVARFSQGQKVLRRPFRVAGISVSTIGSWTSQLFAVFFSVHAFHLAFVTSSGTTRSLGLSGSLLLLILINVAGALPATPGNVGIFQLATVIPLTVAYGIPESTALAFSIGLQAIEGSIGIAGGTISLLREGLTFKQVRTESLREREVGIEEGVEG